jgi:GNAT superfamily N-acetyltransferase
VRLVVRLEPWGERDLSLVQRLMGDPAMTEHLGGPESAEKLVERQDRYERLADSGEGRMLKIVDETTGVSAGSVGYWEKDWRDEKVYEIGWMVLPEFQGLGIAGEATAKAIALARADGKHRFVHAFPASRMHLRTRFAGSLASRSSMSVSSSSRSATSCAATTGGSTSRHAPGRLPQASLASRHPRTITGLTARARSDPSAHERVACVCVRRPGDERKGWPSRRRGPPLFHFNGQPPSTAGRHLRGAGRRGHPTQGRLAW